MIDLPPIPALPDAEYSEMSVGSIYDEEKLEAWARSYGEACAAVALKWRSIESAPKDGTEVIVGCDIATVWIVRSARYVRADEWVPPDPETTDGWWSYRNSVSQEQLDGTYTPTHWMPMPEEPT